MKNNSLDKKSLQVMGMIVITWFLYFLLIKFDYQNDDAWFLHCIRNIYHHDVFAFSVKRYQEWTSRTLIEVVLIILVQFPVLWKCLVALAFSTASILPSMIFSPLHKLDYRTLLLSFGFLWIVPKEVYKDAGWIATTTNYIFPYAAFLIVVYLFSKRFRGEKFSIRLYLLGLLSLIYAANQEQLACVILGSLFLWGVFFRVYKKEDSKLRFALIPLSLSFLSFVNIFISPGNKVRTAIEIKRFFPQFKELSTLTKIKLGFTDTMNTLFFEANLPFLVFLLFLLMICLYHGRKKLALLIVLPLIPVVGTWFPFASVLAYRHRADMAASQGIFLLDNVVVFMVGIICVLGVLYALFSDKLQSLFAILVLTIGICTRLMIGFSPTVFASGKRTYFLLYMSFLFLMIYIFLCQKKMREERVYLGKE
ncbi:DUF6056 family protein [Streptococcus sp. 20-1249]|uniref:DUF6056 family protein n=1 Tax=Streptococcus hepaticus TaxID=3349163 RepID=UPI003747C942